jgi:hypothetical protein
MTDQLTPPSATDDRLAELHERLTAAVDTIVTGEDWRRALEFATHFRSRSFNNSLLIWAQHTAAYNAGRVSAPIPTYVAGFRQWAQLSRSVDKGQSGYMIQAPVTARFATANPQNPASWRRLALKEKPRPGETVRSRMIGVRRAYVWDLSQTSGNPLPVRPQPQLLQGAAPGGLWDQMASQITRRDFTVTRAANAEQLGGANGLTNYTTRRVSVRMDMEEAAQVKTLAHELAHVMMHGPDHPDASLHRGIAEVEAESFALMIGAAHNMDTSAYTIPYVATWATTVEGKTPTEVVQSTGERVRAAAKNVLENIHTQQVGDGDPPGFIRLTPTTEVAPPRPFESDGTVTGPRYPGMTTPSGVQPWTL